MKSIKAIRFRYASSNNLAFLFEDFRLMCNDAIRIALKEKPRSRFELIKMAYLRLKEYGLHTSYILSAGEVAYSVYRNRNRRRDPYVKKAFLKLDNQTYALNHLFLRIPTTPRHFIYLTLQGSNYHFSFIDDKRLKRGSVTINDRSVVIAFSKEIVTVESLGNMGLDVNERNVTTSETSGVTKVFDTSEVAEIKERYRVVRAKIGEKTGRDNRISQKLYAKYGRREKNRTVQRLHRISKAIVGRANAKRLGIVMEKLKGMQRLYRRGNGQGTLYRGRMNSWTFREVQRQIEYKARWEGVPITYVNPRGTSRNCPDCGSPLLELEGRRLLCPSCKQIGDRDVIASRNIMARAVPQARPSRGSREGERGDDGSNPRSRWMEVGLSHQPTTLTEPDDF